MLKKFYLSIFSVIICMPLFLLLLGKAVNKKLDVILNGYTETAQYTDFSFSDYISAEYQKNFEEWINSEIGLNGVITKTYNQLQYSLFNKTKEVALKNDNIITTYFIQDVCKIGKYNFSDADNRDAMSDYVQHCLSVQKKLEQKGKYFLIYTAPDKAEFYYNDIPQKYIEFGDENADRAIDCFQKLIQGTDLNYFDAGDVISKYDEDVPIFCTSGIHWTRPVEQEISNEVIKQLEALSGKRHRTMNLGELTESDSVVWRENDLFLLANLLQRNKEGRFYQYSVKREYPEQYDKLRILMQGDSFGDGVREDIFNYYKSDDEYSLFYCMNAFEADGTGYAINSWEDVDLERILNSVDYVVVEANDAALADYSSGFVEYLDSFLDTYEPKEYIKDDYSSAFDPTVQCGLQYSRGLYGYEGNYAWSGDDCLLKIRNEKFDRNGINIRLTIPQVICEDGKIYVYINQKLSKVIDCDVEEEKDIYISPSEFENIYDDYYEIEFFSTNSFTPNDYGYPNDFRQLSFQLNYLGE